MSASYVVDRNNVVWQVVYDGGMVTRPDTTSASGVTSAGIDWLRGTAGPLRSLYFAQDPMAVAHGEDNERLRWLKWLAETDYGFIWWNPDPEGEHPPVSAAEYAQHYHLEHGNAEKHWTDAFAELARNTGWSDQ